jgi:tripartite-type tricarboxylate transporter receptor subunit TctC
MGRPFFLPPGTPDARTAAVRQAFAATMKDRAFLEEAGRAKLDISPVTGEEHVAIVAKMFNASADVLAAAKAAME